jgi:putative salt-induced outer membrane protein YdiY
MTTSMIRIHRSWRALIAALALLLLPRYAAAQQPAAAQAPPAPPPPPWAVSFSAGLTVSGGNSDVKQYNLGGEVLANPNPRHFAKLYGLFLHGEDTGELTVSRTALEARDQHFIRRGTFVFGQVDYLSDEFKHIDYLIAPVGGIGYQVVKNAAQELLVDAGLGGIWEKNPGREVHASGVLSAGESFKQQLNQAAKLTQEFRGLWKTNNFSDALLTVSVGVTTDLARHLQLKVDLIDSFKNVPPDPQTEKNDYTFVLAAVYKF